MWKYFRNILISLTCLVLIASISFTLGAKPTRAASTSSTSCSTGQWPMYGYNVAGTRYASSEKTLNAANVSTLVENWSFAAGIVDGSTTVANGIAYVGSTNGYLYALNASTGVLLWSYFTSYTGILGTPAVAKGVVYFGSQNKYMYALNASTGALIWSTLLVTALDGQPTVANGIVYIMAQNELEYALKATTGKVLWSYSMGTAYGTESSQVIANGVLYTGPTGGDTLYALNASNGTFLWSYTTTPTSYIAIAPTVVNGVVYFGSGNSVYALNASTGAFLWSYNAGSLVALSPLVANGIVYDGTSNALFALKATNGKQLWFYTGTGASSGGSPTLANGMLYISGGFSGDVYAFSLPVVMPVSPSTLAFSGQAGGSNPVGQTVNLGNTGGGTISWTGCSTQSWLTPSSTSGSINPATSTPLTININNAGLGAGTYFGEVILVPSTGPKVIVTVTLTLT